MGLNNYAMSNAKALQKAAILFYLYIFIYLLILQGIVFQISRENYISDCVIIIYLIYSPSVTPQRRKATNIIILGRNT